MAAAPAATGAIADSTIVNGRNVLITIVSASDLPQIGPLKRFPNAFVEMNVSLPEADKPIFQHRTIVKHSAAPCWDANFPLLDVDEMSMVSFEVVDRFAGKKSLGVAESMLRELRVLAREDGVAILPLKVEPKDNRLEPNMTGSITVRLRNDSADSSVAAMAVKGLQNQPQNDAERSESGFTVSESLGKVVDSLANLMEIADCIASVRYFTLPAFPEFHSDIGYWLAFNQIHPYVNAAWKAVSLVYKCFRNERQFLGSTLEDVIKGIMKQTVECVIFIQEYAGRGFAAKAISRPLSNTEAKIDEFSKSFIGLANSLDTALGVQTALVSLRTQSMVEELALRGRLNPVEMTWTDRPQCHPKTRLEDIQFITDWVMNTSGDRTNVLWLVGPAGSGKSTLSTTIASIFADLGRLGAFIFFGRDVTERSDPSRVIRTMAFELATFDHRISEGVVSATGKYPHIPQMHLEAQFRELVQHPLEASKADISREGPIVVVIDALDECGTEITRRELLSLLAVSTAGLPMAVRIIIASREAPDILRAFNAEPHIHARKLELAKCSRDIEIFLEEELREIANRNEIDPGLIQRGKVAQLVGRASGLWIWAATACRYIDDWEPLGRIDELVAANAEVDLDGLYEKALDLPHWKYGSFKSGCIAILGLVIVAKDPLSPAAIDHILSLSSLPIITRLRSVLHQEGKAGPRCIEVMEQAFGSADVFWQETRTVDESVIYACSYWIVHLSNMKTCSNGLDRKMFEFLSKHFLHWLEAMSMVGRSRTTVGLLGQLLLWVKESVPANEPLIEFIDDGFRFSGLFANTIAKHPRLIHISALPFTPLNSRVYQQFHNGREDLPNVLGGYLKEWSPSLRVLPRTDTARWDSFAFSRNGSKIVSSGGPLAPNENSYLRVWDAMSGVEAFPPIQTDGPSVVAFSADASEIWSASNKGTVWKFSAATGEVLSKLPQQRWQSEFSLPGDFDSRKFRTARASMDPGGRDVTSGTGGEGVPSHPEWPAEWHGTSTLPRANLRGGFDLLTSFTTRNSADPNSLAVLGLVNDMPRIPIQPHDFTRAAICSDGSMVAFGSADGMLRVVDVMKEKEKYATLKGGCLNSRRLSRLFRSVEFSRDGIRLASGSGSGTIYVWATASGQGSLKELEGHQDEVHSRNEERSGKTKSRHRLTWCILSGT
ncbi:hypothetical protein JAAARDRAFT_46862 [Jaapia argillacea MUCL 33604]|uniref:NACHT domain-containing protein n=1 Tax=Jaapia argillacea MUCL 33604 TaxID=933084 RepID=A0A067Q6Y8_9AGAM|nr:hypothetical protein JAAARDRAFT_46862 [Jaapia argillacea MUCL 33604]